MQRAAGSTCCMERKKKEIEWLSRILNWEGRGHWQGSTVEKKPNSQLMRTKWTIDFSANSSPPWGSSWGWITYEQDKGTLSVCPPNVRGVFPGSEVSKPFPQKGQMTNIFSLASHLIHVANTRFCLWSLNAAVDSQKQMGVAKLAWEQKGLDPCYSKHGPWSSNISMPWKLVRNAESQAPPGATWIRICCS